MFSFPNGCRLWALLSIAVFSVSGFLAHGIGTPPTAFATQLKPCNLESLPNELQHRLKADQAHLIQRDRQLSRTLGETGRKINVIFADYRRVAIGGEQPFPAFDVA